jgi:hypothetical protein
VVSLFCVTSLAASQVPSTIDERKAASIIHKGKFVSAFSPCFNDIDFAVIDDGCSTVGFAVNA